ncbi:hypothetical protein DY000_02000615 [Brassica cretica]|uniref:Uncharacterized protein n=1 Tax=Brassica cretica TaxID=69181 RepID=A0ABQ7CG04_BRACR|nr:hypothetical protein DY000_02000615 [Brassica cretica]
MGQSCFFNVLIVSSLLLLVFFSTGNSLCHLVLDYTATMGRNLHTASLQGVYSAAELSPSKDESVRKMMELMDYQPVESNTNWNGFVATPPPQSPPLS